MDMSQGWPKLCATIKRAHTLGNGQMVAGGSGDRVELDGQGMGGGGKYGLLFMVGIMCIGTVHGWA